MVDLLRNNKNTRQYHARQNYSHQTQHQSYNTTYQRQPQHQTHKHNQQVSNIYRHKISNVNRYRQNQKRTIPSRSINKQYTTNVDNSQDIRISQQQQQSTTTQHSHNNTSHQGHTQKPCTLQSLQSQNAYGTPLMTHHTPKTQDTQQEQQQMKKPSTYHRHCSESKTVQSPSQIDQSQNQNLSSCNVETQVSLVHSNLNPQYSDYYSQNFPPLVPLPRQTVYKSPIMYNQCTPLSTTADLISASSNVLSNNSGQTQVSDNTFDRSSPSYAIMKL